VTGDLLLSLLRRARTVAPDALVDLIIETAVAAGALDVEVLLVDHQLLHLVRAPGTDRHERVVDIEGTPPGEAFMGQERFEVPIDGGGVRMWLPITEIADRLGILGLTLDHVDDERRQWCEDLAALAATLHQDRQRYTDSFHRVRRLHPMNLPAELQWSLLPPLNFAAPGVTLSGLLEPAYEIGGDAFDYALNGSTMHFALFDAMGHGLDAASIAAVAVGGYRNQRREGASLRQSVVFMDAAVMAQFGGDRFCTAQLGELDVQTGVVRWLSAGHPSPLRVRGSEVERLAGKPPRVPIGLGGDDVEVAELQLEPGDRLFFYSDGVVEARSPSGVHFGEDRLRHVVAEHASALPGEQVRQVIQASMRHQASVLRDDATVLALEWLGPPGA
jgi:serine phosphatase RsbU (regulator of sigma subunit)